MFRGKRKNGKRPAALQKAVKAAGKVKPSEVPTPARAGNTGFPIVGIGASAGGLAAIEAFFSAIPRETGMGMAFVLVQHLDPDHKSILVDLVKQYTNMPVSVVKDGMKVEPDCVYIIPPNQDMAFYSTRLHLLEPGNARGLRLPIDFFFRSLAQDQRERAVCIVLSGTGSDGSAGLKAIKGEGGMCMVQAPESAAYDGMPRSAIATGLADYVLSPEKMPEQLIQYGLHAFGHRAIPVTTAAPNVNDIMQKVFLLLRNQTGHDFSLYKHNTISRRVERRMAVTQIGRLEDYVRFLRENKTEIETLFRELLIGVTNFFRDAEAFDSLEKNVIQELFRNHPDEPVRIWVPGCSTGEEAYSIAILVREFLDQEKQNQHAQIFATDIDAEAIEKSRAGIFPESVAADISPERLARYFSKNNASYRVNKSVRDLVMFAKQDVLKDPPFSKVDLISCRNLLIYLDSTAQKKLIPLFHYALNPRGFLFLGNSESTGEFNDLFTGVDKKWKIYSRKNTVMARPAAVPFAQPAANERVSQRAVSAGRQGQPLSPRTLAEQMMLETGVPASVLVNREFDVLYIHGRTGRYLEPASGEASMNLLKMARGGLRLELAAMGRKALAKETPVRHDGFKIKSNNGISLVNLVVRPVTKPESARGLLLISFEEAALSAGKPGAEIPDESEGITNQRLLSLEQDLQAKEEYLQATIEELETANEELKSSNEELQSTNEELQSTNEEMETSKEELQSVNEELITVNTELQKKMEDLSRSNNDMNNLMAGTNIATLFVDHALRIQRFTPAITQIINLIQADIGRPVGDIVSRLAEYNRLVPDAQSVLDTLIPREVEVQTKEGRWYQMRIQPYRTLENVIEGAVITFVETTEMKNAEKDMRLAVVVRDSTDAIAVLDFNGKILAWNPAAERMYGWSEAEALTKDFRDMVPEENRKNALNLIKRIGRNEKIEALQLKRLTKEGKIKEILLVASVLLNQERKPYAISTTEREIPEK